MRKKKLDLGERPMELRSFTTVSHKGCRKNYGFGSIQVDPGSTRGSRFDNWGKCVKLCGKPCYRRAFYWHPNGVTAFDLCNTVNTVTLAALENCKHMYVWAGTNKKMLTNVHGFRKSFSRVSLSFVKTSFAEQHLSTLLATWKGSLARALRVLLGPSLLSVWDVISIGFGNI